MAGFDVDAAIRWARFDPRKTLARRADAELPFVDEERIGGQGLLLDTCVYIDQLSDRSPSILDQLVATRQTNHSTVAIQELMHTVGVLDPRDVRTPAAAAAIRDLVRSMPPHRVLAPDTDVLGRAALLSGMLCRLQGHGADRRLRALHDCVLFLQAQKLGLTILTANIGDFDILQQLLPTGRVLFYRRK
ncbi:type II toxin-antitoxin system VapC family toxin [Vineibacter terrae]|uniref:Type II toxin-antitoxin system VapC family toxin n=1 Tax=Vineibacter terrae TaxID=2586908 RepID=A0A5C8PDD3_9HYPH|nr:type II toxin-antitoxin system VapC family toxin [Vineibacter terrae]TXL71734.1 type II toxin-antitoxin system VapC family toxin [Vineibacter terrae]